MRSLGRSAALLLVAAGLTGVSLYFLIRARREHKERCRCSRSTHSYAQIPRAWKQVGHVTQLVLYPLKAGHPSSVERAFCDEKGLSDGRSLSDRCFLLFDRRRGTYISNHKYSQLVRVKVSAPSEDVIQFSVHNDASVAPFPLSMTRLAELNARSSSVHTITMYEKDVVSALDCGDAASQWFSTVLTGSQDDNIRLGYSRDEQRRLNGTVYERYRHFYGRQGRHISNEDMGRFSYFASYMLMNEASVGDLNERLRAKGEQPVSVHNFRGNIVVSTDACYAEDRWSWVRLRDEVILRVMKPCTRCKMTCLDPHTGRVDPHLEPLQTLREYRGQLSEEARLLEKASPRLGLYCGLYRRGEVRVGDAVYVEASEPSESPA